MIIDRAMVWKTMKNSSHGYFIFYTIFILSFLITANELDAQVISGRVESRGKGVSDVVVSNGYEVAVTDKNGKYSLDNSRDKHFVFISTPAGFQLNAKEGIPNFYQRIEKSKISGYDFELSPLEESDLNHAFFLHADAQVLKEKELIPYQAAIDDCKELLQGHQLRNNFFGIDCGDLVFDNPGLYPSYAGILGQLDIPFFRVPGNHDMNYNNRSDENSTLTYESFFGPSYYSFNRGKAHYIILDDVFYLGREFYYIGYLTEEILTWLENDLSKVAPGTLLFVAFHIPTSLEEGKEPFSYSRMAERVSNREMLFKILEPYNAHLLAGHTHYQKNLIHTPSLREHINAAVSGAWYQGPVCVDGTPVGYQVFDIRGDSVSWYYKSIGYDRSYQMKVYQQGDDGKYPDEFIANIWNWDAGWSVKWYENGKDMGEMTRYDGIDPDARRYYSDKEKLEHKWISPQMTSHLFKARASDPNAVIEVVATDGFGEVFKARLNK